MKYYPSNDFFFGHNLTKIAVIQIPEFSDVTVNDAIEFYEISKYFNEDTRHKNWTDDNFKEYKEKSKTLSGITRRFFNQIRDENIIDLYKQLESQYHSSFWQLFENCKLYNVISQKKFQELIEREKISPFDIFKHKNIVMNYGIILRDYIMSNDFCITIILHVYDQNFTENEKLFLPEELTGEDICNFLESFIESENPNANYLQAIYEMQRDKRFPISDEIRLKAKRKYRNKIDNLSENSVRIEWGYQLLFDGEQEEVTKASDNGRDFCISYSTKWLLETLDYPSILNNFIYIFEFVDNPQMRSLHVNKTSQSSVFERAFASKSSRMYKFNYAFNSAQALASLQINAYYNFLEQQGIHLEDVLKWFFTEYLQKEFGCPEMRVFMPSINSSYSEKCSSIITAFETILKQYSLYLKNDSIDFELVSISSTPILFENVNSQIKNKYVYGNGEDYKRISFFLFSDQCMFSYVDRLHKQGNHCKCFVDLLMKETVYTSDYREEELKSFEYLASYDLITIKDDGEIKLNDMAKLVVFSDLFKNDVISKHHCYKPIQEAIKFFVEKGILVEKSTLFSQPEIDYLNYLLNRAEFCNGLEIRNKYVHGIQQVNLNEDEHRQNYYVLLRLFILLAIKINDEFCLNEHLQKTEQDEPQCDS